MNNKPAFPLGEPIEGYSHQGMTLREYAAIHLKVPDSGDPELDKMILRGLRNDLAAKAMQSFLAEAVVGPPANKETDAMLAMAAYVIADAMLAESGI